MILRVPLGRETFPPTMKKELMDKLQRLRQGSVIVKEYRQQMEVLLLRVGLRQEERTSIATFLSGLNMKVRDKVPFIWGPR